MDTNVKVAKVLLKLAKEITAGGEQQDIQYTMRAAKKDIDSGLRYLSEMQEREMFPDELERLLQKANDLGSLALEFNADCGTALSHVKSNR